MSAKKPGKITYRLKDGTEHRLVVAIFEITSKNIRGVPLTLRMIENEESIEMKDDMEFMTAYIDPVMLEGDI